MMKTSFSYKSMCTFLTLCLPTPPHPSPPHPIIKHSVRILTSKLLFWIIHLHRTFWGNPSLQRPVVLTDLPVVKTS